MTQSQRKKIRRLRRAGFDCCTIATATNLDVKAISGFIAAEKNLRSRNSMGEISRLVTVKDPDAWMRRHKVDYRRTG